MQCLSFLGVMLPGVHLSLGPTHCTLGFPRHGPTQASAPVTAVWNATPLSLPSGLGGTFANQLTVCDPPLP